MTLLWYAGFEYGMGQNKWYEFGESSGGHTPDYAPYPGGEATEEGCESSVVEFAYGGNGSMRCHIPANIKGNRAEGNRWAYTGHSGYPSSPPLYRMEYDDHYFVGSAIYLPDGFQVAAGQYCTIRQIHPRSSILGSDHISLGTIRVTSAGKLAFGRRIPPEYPGYVWYHVTPTAFPFGEWLPVVYEILAQDPGYFKIWYGEDMEEGSPEGTWEGDMDMDHETQKTGYIQFGLYQAEYCDYPHTVYHDEFRVATTWEEARPVANGAPEAQSEGEVFPPFSEILAVLMGDD